MARHQDSQAVAAGKRILAGESKTPTEVLDLVKKELKKERAFGLARKLLDQYAEDPQVRGDADLRVKIAQQRALCTYKDPDLPAGEKLNQALSILQADADLARTTDRARALSQQLKNARSGDAENLSIQIKILYRRSRILLWAISLSLALHRIPAACGASSGTTSPPRSRMPITVPHALNRPPFNCVAPRKTAALPPRARNGLHKLLLDLFRIAA